MAAPSLQVKLDLKELRSTNKKLRRRAYTAARFAINETARTAKSQAIKKVAEDLKLPPKFVRFRWSSKKSGGKPIKTKQRILLYEAKKANLSARIWVHLRGLPVSAIAGAEIKQAKSWTKGAQSRGSRQFGVKAKGGRFYRKAFKDSQGQVWKRRSNGKNLMMPKIGMRDDLIKEFNDLIVSPKARTQFKRVYDRILRAKLKEYNWRTGRRS